MGTTSEDYPLNIINSRDSGNKGVIQWGGDDGVCVWQKCETREPHTSCLGDIMTWIHVFRCKVHKNWLLN